MTSDALGPVRRSYAAATRPGTPIPRLKISNLALDPVAQGSALANEGGHDRQHGGDDRPPPRPAETPPPAATLPEPHPLVYLAVDTVTGEVLWQVGGDAAPADGAERPGAYGPHGQLVYRRDPEEGPHGISRLV